MALVRCPLCGAEAERVQRLVSYGTLELISCSCAPKTKPWVWVSPRLARVWASGGSASPDESRDA